MRTMKHVVVVVVVVVAVVAFLIMALPYTNKKN